MGGMAVALEGRVWLAHGWVRCSAGTLLREVGGSGGVDRRCRVLRRIVGGRRGHYEGEKRTDGRDSWLMWVGVSCSKAAIQRSKRKKIMGRDCGTLSNMRYAGLCSQPPTSQRSPTHHHGPCALEWEAGSRRWSKPSVRHIACCIGSSSPPQMAGLSGRTTGILIGAIHTPSNLYDSTLPDDISTKLSAAEACSKHAVRVQKCSSMIVIRPCALSAQYITNDIKHQQFR